MTGIKRKAPTKHLLLSQTFLHIFYYSLYLVVSFFIIIGEATKYIILLPISIINNAYLSTKKQLLGLKKSFKKPTFSLPQFKLPAQKSTPLKKLKPAKKAKTAAWLIVARVFVKQITDFLFFVVSFIGRVIGGIFAIIWYIITLPYKIFLTFFSVQFRFFVLGFIFCVGVMAVYQGYIFYKSLPSPSLIGKVNFPLSTHIYDRNGRLLYEVYRDQNRTPVKFADLPPYIYQATIAFEDRDFRRHNGISLYSGLLRAVKETILKKQLQGGSTITQQLVKTSLLSPERTLTRKAKEIILAIMTERYYTKDQILEMYLNQVPYGGSAYGVEEAAKTYFNKHASELTLSQAALLAGLPQSPSVYSPFVNPDLAISRRNEVLTKMYEQGYITQDAEKLAMKEKLTFAAPLTDIKAPHFVFYVKNELEKQYGIDKVEQGGFNVTTSLDLNLQEQLEQILREEVAKLKSLDVSNGAILVTKPQTGEILAMVGSTDYFSQPDGAFNVTTALRQPGSSIKPLMYSLALERGYTAATIISDVPTSFPDGTNVYAPVNYDGRFHGAVPLRYALANSYNIPAVKALQSVGVQQFVDHARNMGITTWNDSSRFGLSLTLGGGEVLPIDMATAFGVFANGGYRIPANGILKLQNDKGEIMDELTPTKVKVMDDSITYVMSDILSDNNARVAAFGPHSQLEIPGYKVAVKTGTTDNKKDNWTIGYTPDFVVVVWVGNNDGHPMNPFLTSGVTGAAPIWNRVMTYLLKNNPNNAWFTKPDQIVERVCSGHKEVFVAGTENSAGCQVDKNVGSIVMPAKPQ